MKSPTHGRFPSPSSSIAETTAQVSPTLYNGEFRRDLTVTQKLRNIAIIAHVDHGKTTLVDQLLRQSGTLDARKDLQERVMASNDLGRGRGITILQRNTAITGGAYPIKTVNPPGPPVLGAGGG